MEGEGQQEEVMEPLPIDKLKRPEGGFLFNIFGNGSLSNTTRTPVVIFYNGTFCPIHPGHINALVAARDHLNSKVPVSSHNLHEVNLINVPQGYQVLGGYLSPCWGGYCYRKLQEDRYAKNFAAFSDLHCTPKDRHKAQTQYVPLSHRRS